MQEFFHGWKRKVGYVTLLLSCLFAIGWVRSCSIQDTMAIATGHGSAVQFVSACQCAIFVKTEVLNPSGSFKPRFWRARDTGRGWWHLAIGDATSPWDTRPFRLDHPGYQIGVAKYSATTFQLPYWSIVTPLTLLAAWLLLSKPRRAKPATESSV